MTKKTQVLELDKRHATISHVNLREEKHGEDSVPAIDIKLTEIPLTKDELIAITHDKQAWNLMYVEEKGGLIRPSQPYFASKRPFDEKYVDCSAVLFLGIQGAEYELEDVKLSKITMEPTDGGTTSMDLTIQLELDDTEILSHLADQLGRECSVALTFGSIDEGDKKQQKLPLNSTAGTDAPASTH